MASRTENSDNGFFHVTIDNLNVTVTIEDATLIQHLRVKVIVFDQMQRTVDEATINSNNNPWNKDWLAGTYSLKVFKPPFKSVNEIDHVNDLEVP